MDLVHPSLTLRVTIALAAQEKRVADSGRESATLTANTLVGTGPTDQAKGECLLVIR